MTQASMVSYLLSRLHQARCMNGKKGNTGLVSSGVLFVVLGGIIFLFGLLMLQETYNDVTPEQASHYQVILAANNSATALDYTPKVWSWAKVNNRTWLDLDGVNDYINISDNDYFSANNITGDLTVSFWVKIPSFQFNGTDGTTGYIEYAGKGRTAWNNPEWGFRVYNSSNTAKRTCRMTMYFWNITGGEGAGAYVEANESETACTNLENRWMHVVGTLNESRISIWIDGRKDRGGSGSLLSTYAIKDGMMPGDSAVRFGTRQVTGFLNMSIDDIQIFNRSINHTEALAMNATQRNGTVVNSTALVGRWKLNDRIGSVVYDSSGKAVNGTIIGGGSWDDDNVELTLTENTDYTKSGTTFTIKNDWYAWDSINTSYTWENYELGVRGLINQTLAGYGGFSEYFDLLVLAIVIGAVLMIVVAVTGRRYD